MYEEVPHLRVWGGVPWSGVVVRVVGWWRVVVVVVVVAVGGWRMVVVVLASLVRLRGGGSVGSRGAALFMLW